MESEAYEKARIEALTGNSRRFYKLANLIEERRYNFEQEANNSLRRTALFGGLALFLTGIAGNGAYNGRKE